MVPETIGFNYPFRLTLWRPFPNTKQILISFLEAGLNEQAQIQTLKSTCKEHFSNHTGNFYNKGKSHKAREVIQLI